MTRKDIEEAHLCMTEDGTIALCRDNKGRKSILREITPKEIQTIIHLFYNAYMEKNDEARFMPLPVDAEHILAVSLHRINSEQDSQG